VCVTEIAADCYRISTYIPETHLRLAALNPLTFAPMHGSGYVGDGAKAVRDLGAVTREVLGIHSKNMG
jgi:hypothetical protein